MSPTGYFVLSALIERGPLHGHALRHLADEEHVTEWTDISVGGLYAALRRMEKRGLIESVRTEREGNYPERVVYDITDAGREAFVSQRRETAVDTRLVPDPFELILARGGEVTEDQLRETVEVRLEQFRARAQQMRERIVRIEPYLWLSEQFALQHRLARVETEIAWHETLLGRISDVVADERVRRQKKGRKV